MVCLLWFPDDYLHYWFVDEWTDDVTEWMHSSCCTDRNYHRYIWQCNRIGCLLRVCCSRWLESLQRFAYNYMHGRVTLDWTDHVCKWLYSACCTDRNFHWWMCCNTHIRQLLFLHTIGWIHTDRRFLDHHVYVWITLGRTNHVTEWMHATKCTDRYDYRYMR